MVPALGSATQIKEVDALYFFIFFFGFGHYQTLQLYSAVVSTVIIMVRTDSFIVIALSSFLDNFFES